MRKLSASAQQLAKRSQKEGLFCFASLDGKVEAAADSTAEILGHKFSVYACKECASVLTAEANTTPFCVTCGSEHVAEHANLEASVSNLKLSDDKLCAVKCASCDSTTIVTSEAFQASAGHLNCITCGEAIEASAEITAEGSETVKLQDDDAVGEPPLKVEDAEATASKKEKAKGIETRASDYDEIEFDDDSIDDDDFEGDGGDFIGSEAVDSVNGPEPYMQPQGDEIGVEDVVLQNAGSDLDDDYVGDSVDMLDEDLDDPMFDDDDGTYLMDAVDMDDDDTELELMSVGNAVVAMKKLVTVAKLTAKDAGSNADLIGSPALAKTVKALAKREGMRKALSTMGFKPVRVKLLSQATVEAATKDATTKATASIKKANDEMTESLALAAAALARNAWKSVDNPLYSHVLAAFSAYNVRNPNAAARSFCLEIQEPYTSALLKVAAQLQEKGADYRKTLASTFHDTTAETHTHVSEGTEDDVLDDTEQVTSALAVGAVPISTKPQRAIAAVENADIYAAIVSGPLNLG